MPILDTLTLSTAARNRAVAGEPVFRGKLADAIDLQIAAVQAEQKGEAFRRTTERLTANKETGQRERATVPVRFRPWWWKDAAGQVFLEVRYANKPVEIKPGKSAITVGTVNRLVPILEQIKKAVLAGELDRQLVGIISTRRVVELPGWPSMMLPTSTWTNTVNSAPWSSQAGPRHGSSSRGLEVHRQR